MLKAEPETTNQYLASLINVDFKATIKAKITRISNNLCSLTHAKISRLSFLDAYTLHAQEYCEKYARDNLLPSIMNWTVQNDGLLEIREFL